MTKLELEEENKELKELLGLIAENLSSVVNKEEDLCDTGKTILEKLKKLSGTDPFYKPCFEIRLNNPSYTLKEKLQDWYNSDETSYDDLVKECTFTLFGEPVNFTLEGFDDLR